MNVDRTANLLDALAIVLDTADETDLLEGLTVDVDALRTFVYGFIGAHAGLEPWGTLPTREVLLEALSQDGNNHGPG